MMTKRNEMWEDFHLLLNEYWVEGMVRRDGEKPILTHRHHGLVLLVSKQVNNLAKRLINMPLADREGMGVLFFLS